MPDLTTPAAAPPDWLRLAVRGVLVRSPGYHQMPADQRRSLAQAMVKVSKIAAALIAEECDAEASLPAPRAAALEAPAASATRYRQPLARAQDAPPFGT
ncbi:hypothetical protein [Cupriavidus necator]|uniref:hypothetical protein n=1 Tax=Cupriavidus necator TaxID=106590 RepID=UPI0005B33A99|nr:hypothetical protein [Cupriavidus necator]